MSEMTVTEFAKRMGVTRNAVDKAIKSRRITAHRRDGKGRTWINSEAAATEWALNTDPIEAAKNGKLWTVPKADKSARRESQHAEKPAGRLPPPLSAGDEAPDFMEARASKEDANAKLAHLELQERLGVLVPKSDVEKAAFAVARTLRDALLTLPDRMAPRLAAETDWAAIRADLDNEIRSALNGLSDRLSAPATAGHS
jgi:excisionase family DNA binding protein